MTKFFIPDGITRSALDNSDIQYIDSSDNPYVDEPYEVWLGEQEAFESVQGIIDYALRELPIHTLEAAIAARKK